MPDELRASKAAWERALGGMRYSHPTYKPTLLLAILERLDLEESAGRPFAGAAPADMRLSIAFDLKLRGHAAFREPGRIFMPLEYLSVRAGRQPDQLWTAHGERLEVEPEYRAVLATRTGRDWLRGLILGWLEERAGASAPQELVRLARLVRGDAAGELLHESDEDTAGLGLEVRVAAGRSELIDGDPVFGERLLACLARGEYGMEILATPAKRRQGQRLFAYYVLANFSGWCAFCTIGARPLLEAAHLKPVREFPEIGLDPLNGVSLCRNHHRALDEGILRWSGAGVALATGHDSDRMQGLLDPLLPTPRAPRHPLRMDAVEWRALMGNGDGPPPSS